MESSKLLQQALTTPGHLKESVDRLYLTDWPRVAGFDHVRTIGALKIELVPFTKDDDDVHGYSDDSTIAINRGTPYPIATLWHELGHILCEHTKRLQPGQPLAELEAEAVSYLLQHHFNYLAPQAASRGYLQAWLSRTDLTTIPADSMPYIERAFKRIVEANNV